MRPGSPISSICYVQHPPGMFLTLGWVPIKSHQRCPRPHHNPTRINRPPSPPSVPPNWIGLYCTARPPPLPPRPALKQHTHTRTHTPLPPTHTRGECSIYVGIARAPARTCGSRKEEGEEKKPKAPRLQPGAAHRHGLAAHRARLGAILAAGGQRPRLVRLLAAVREQPPTRAALVGRALAGGCCCCRCRSLCCRWGEATLARPLVVPLLACSR